MKGKTIKILDSFQSNLNKVNVPIVNNNIKSNGIYFWDTDNYLCIYSEFRDISGVPRTV
jgi:hypothetical protein